MKKYATSHERMVRRTVMIVAYVCSGARGRKVVNGDDATEKELYRRIESYGENRSMCLELSFSVP